MSLKELGKIKAQNEEDVRRQALIVFSDGEDTSSLVSFEEVLDLASGRKRRSTRLRFAATTPALADFVRRNSSCCRSRRKLVDGLFPAKIEDLSGYAQIADELASQHTLGYTSKNLLPMAPSGESSSRWHGPT